MLKEYILLLVIVLGVSSCTAWLDPDVPDFHFYYCLNGEQFSCKKYHSRSIITSIMKEENEVFLQRTNHSGKAFFKMFIIEPFELYFEYVGDEECFIEGEKYVLTKNNLEYPDTLDDGWFSLNTST